MHSREFYEEAFTNVFEEEAKYTRSQSKERDQFIKETKLAILAESLKRIDPTAPNFDILIEEFTNEYIDTYPAENIDQEQLAAKVKQSIFETCNKQKKEETTRVADKFIKRNTLREMVNTELKKRCDTLEEAKCKTGVNSEKEQKLKAAVVVEDITE